MKKAFLDRRQDSLQGTIGTFCIPMVMYSCLSLELPWKYNQPDISRIPEGGYPVVWEYSPAFKRNLYEIKNIPKRSECKFHAGNFAGSVDDGYKSDVKGCILLGLLITELEGQVALVHPESAFMELERRMAGEPFELIVGGLR